jgi:predicted HicB family RNase H-like nuclease
MSTALSGIAIDAACRLTAGKAQYQTPTVVTSPQSPHVGPDFAGPFSTPEAGPNPAIEVKQEWTAMRIDARRDLLADVAIAVLDTIASFNPRTASGAREALAAVIAFKDRLIGLLEEGTWTISQDWSFDFKIEGSHCCVVQPTLMARAWKNDSYFKWDVRLETRLNGASVVAEDHSRDETRALSVIGLAPEPVFASTAQPGVNTVTQSITANVRFQGYMDEFRDTLAALDRAVSFLGEQIQNIWDWFTERLDDIMSDDSKTDQQKQEEERRAEQERLRRERRAAERGAELAEQAKPSATSAINRLRTHIAYFDVDYSRVRVTGVSGSVEQNQGMIDRNQRSAAAENRLKDGQQQLRDALELPPTGKRGELPLRGIDERLRQELTVWSSKKVLRHQLAIRRLAFERLPHDAG